MRPLQIFSISVIFITVVMCVKTDGRRLFSRRYDKNKVVTSIIGRDMLGEADNTLQTFETVSVSSFIERDQLTICPFCLD